MGVPNSGHNAWLFWPEDKPADSRRVKKAYIDKLEPGATGTDVWLVSAASQKTMKSGKPYYTITLVDKTGSIDGRFWNNTLPLPKPGDYLQVSASVEEFNGTLQFKITSYLFVDASEVNREEFERTTPYDREMMWNYVQQTVAAMAAGALRDLCKELLIHNSGDIINAPAAKKAHQPYVGGLLEHIYRMMKIVRGLRDHYPIECDWDLLYAACLWHDIGKIRELSWKNGIDFTVEGRALGHVHIGMCMLATARETIAMQDDDPKKLDHLAHVIASHHGQYADTKPASLEASLFHCVDLMDSRVAIMEEICHSEQPDDNGFTRFNNLLDGPAWFPK